MHKLQEKNKYEPSVFAAKRGRKVSSGQCGRGEGIFSALGLPLKVERGGGGVLQ